MSVVRAGIATLVAASTATISMGTTARAAPTDAPPPRPARSAGARPLERAAASRSAGRQAPKVEALVGRLGVRRLREIRAQAVADLNRAASESFGPIDAARATVLARAAYFEDRDIDVFVTDPDLLRLAYVAVP